MKLLLDLQPVQGESGFRGIGRYSQSLAMALIEQCVRRNHDIHLLLRKLDSRDVNSSERQVRELLPPSKVHHINLPRGTAESVENGPERKMEAVALREEAIKHISPDIFYVSSVLEGYLDDVISNVMPNNTYSCKVINAVTLYDLIPLAMPEIYLQDPKYKTFYMRQLENFQKADALLAISEFSKKQAHFLLGIDPKKIHVIGGGVPEVFSLSSKPNRIDATLSSLGIAREFVLYVPGGFDPRKNFARLIEAFASMPNELQRRYQLVIASKLPPGVGEWLRDAGRLHGLEQNSLVLTDYVSDCTLRHLYERCTLMAFPSLMEGLGLPVLEAMACGAPVVASNTSSLPEVLGSNDGVFDPLSAQDICRVLTKVLCSIDDLERLRARSLRRCTSFTWSSAASKALDHLEDVLNNR